MPRRNSKGRYVFVKGDGRHKSRSSSTSTSMVRHSGGRGRGSQVLVVREGGGRKISHSRARRTGSAVLATSQITGPALMAAALGYAKKQGWELPVIGELGEDATLAIIGYAALKFGVVPQSLRKHVANATLAAIVLAAHELGNSGNVPGLSKKSGGGEAKAQGAGPQFHTYEVK
jgi:hypothetical protein